MRTVENRERRILTRIGSAFALILAITSCWGYYIQWSSVLQTVITGGDLAGLGQFAEGNATSPGMATLQLGWAFFYGLATLAVAPLFSAKGIERWIKIAFPVNGVIGVGVGLGYAYGFLYAMLLDIFNLIVTALAYPLLAIYFSRKMQAAPSVQVPLAEHRLAS